MRIDLKIDPATLPTAQQKGVTRAGRVYTKAKVRSAKEQLTLAIIRDFYKKLRVNPVAEFDLVRRDFSVPWSVAIEFVYALKSTPKRNFGLPKATRPDLDNLTKLVLDALTESGVAFADDGQVAILQVRKRHARAGEDAHVRLVFEPAEGEGGRWTWL